MLDNDRTMDSLLVFLKKVDEVNKTCMLILLVFSKDNTVMFSLRENIAIENKIILVKSKKALRKDKSYLFALKPIVTAFKKSQIVSAC